MLTLLFMGIGYTLGGMYADTPFFGTGIFLAIIISLNLVSYFFSDRIVLRAYRARIVNETEAPRLHGIISGLAEKAGMPMPRVAIIPSNTPNAFATGRNPKHAVVAATEGILQLLDDRELTGVMAHEMSHVKNRDILVMTVAATMAGFIAFAARIYFWRSMFGGSRRNENPLIMILVLVVAALGAMLVQLAISRTREYKADATGAAMINDPLALASALGKLEHGNRRIPMRIGSPTSSSLFIANPFAGGGSFFTRAFSTHPPMEERIKRLREMA